MADLEQLINIDSDTYEAGLGERISRHFKLFTSFMNLGRRFMLAHNRFVSIYNMSKKRWSDHERFDEPVRQIFRNRKIESKYDD